MLQIVKSIFSSWNKNEIIYCSWKGNGHLDDAINGTSDFDILLSDESLEKGTLLLKEAGYMLFVTQPEARYPGIQDWIGVDTITGTMIHIHLHQYMIAGHSGVMEYILPWNELAFSTRQFNDKYGIYQISPSLEIILLYTRLGIEHSPKKLKKSKGEWVLKDKTRNEISYLKDRMDEILCKEMAKELFPSCHDSLIQSIEKDDINSKELEQIIKLMKKVCSKWMRHNKLTLFFLQSIRKCQGIYRNIISRIALRQFITKKVPTTYKGISVAFIGQDGCGKSTVTLEIEKWLNWKIEAHRFYLGSGDHYNGLLKRIISKGRNLKNKNAVAQNRENIKSDTKNKRRKKNLRNFIAAFLVSQNHINVARRAYKVVLRSEKYRKKGGTPLFDRFPQTQFPGIYDGPKIATYIQETGLNFWLLRGMAKKEERYIKAIQNYQPQIVFKLMLPPEESVRRKPFEDINAVTRKHEITKQLQFNNSKVYVVDATQDYNSELVFIKNKIWEEIIRVQ